MPNEIVVGSVVRIKDEYIEKYFESLSAQQKVVGTILSANRGWQTVVAVVHNYVHLAKIGSKNIVFAYVPMSQLDIHDGSK
jgi:hypothetical protein